MAQVNFLKSIPDSAGWQEMETTDDLTLNSFTGDGSSLTNLNMSNASSGILDKAFYDSSMAGTGLDFSGGVLSIPLYNASGLGVDATGMFVDADGTTIGIVGTKLAVVGDFATEAFSTINFITEDDVVATTHNDTVNFVAGTGIAFSTVPGTKTLTFTSTASGGGGTYTASNGVTESPSNNFILDVSNFNNWQNTQQFSGFTGIKLDIQGIAGDGTNPVFRVRDSGGSPTLTMTQAGYLNCIDASFSGDVVLGTTSADSLEIFSSIVSNLTPDASTSRDLGDSTHRWNDLYVDRLLGSSKTVSTNNLVDKSATETVTGAWSFSGSINLGASTANTLTIASVIDSNLLPDASNTRTLGGASNRWEDLYVDDIIDTNGSIIPTTRFQLIPDSGTSKPAASASVRGHIYVTEGGPLVADVVEICLKSSSDTYSWVNLATG